MKQLSQPTKQAIFYTNRTVINSQDFKKLESGVHNKTHGFVNSCSVSKPVKSIPYLMHQQTERTEKFYIPCPHTECIPGLVETTEQRLIPYTALKD
jgi:hypothetical protein